MSEAHKVLARDAMRIARHSSDIPDEYIRETMRKMDDGPFKDALIEEYLKDVPVDDKELIEAELRGK